MTPALNNSARPLHTLMVELCMAQRRSRRNRVRAAGAIGAVRICVSVWRVGLCAASFAGRL